MSQLHPLFEKRRRVRLHFLARQLALNLSGLATRQPQVASPQWILCSEWPGYWELEGGDNVDTEVLRELLHAAVSFAPAKGLWDLRPYPIAAMLRQLSTEEQQLLCKLFKELYCDSLPSIR